MTPSKYGLDSRKTPMSTIEPNHKPSEISTHQALLRQCLVLLCSHNSSTFQCHADADGILQGTRSADERCLTRFESWCLEDGQLEAQQVSTFSQKALVVVGQAAPEQMLETHWVLGEELINPVYGPQLLFVTLTPARQMFGLRTLAETATSSTSSTRTVSSLESTPSTKTRAYYEKNKTKATGYGEIHVEGTQGRPPACPFMTNFHEQRAGPPLDVPPVCLPMPVSELLPQALARDALSPMPIEAVEPLGVERGNPSDLWDCIQDSAATLGDNFEVDLAADSAAFDAAIPGFWGSRDVEWMILDNMIEKARISADEERKEESCRRKGWSAFPSRTDMLAKSQDA
ncbi:hypothetical protein BJ878DRAFT_477668 [Calycina marina]|uniref:Uncharacterized protein n=1 Tax=Calycina marina TaxID=1763456 RepID=A0A9P7Z7S9_9HELO|nr:hypothetical protein BJ878DRAFT_477668 [Calycina marina]